MIDQKSIIFLLEEKYNILTEEQIAYLVENRIEFIKNAVKDKISTEHDPASAKLNSDKIVDHIANKIDPTPNKSHTQWLVNRYKSGDFQLGDKSIKKTLESYEESKKHLENSDLNSYKSISHLRDSLVPVQSRVKAVRERTAEEKSSADMPVVFQEGGNTGYKIPSKSASIKNYGPNGKLAKTNWCTAAEGKNMFNGYNGGKYTLHLDNGHILQLNHQSGQMMDIRDKNVDTVHDPRFSDHRGIINKFIKHTHELEGKPDSNLLPREELPSHELDAMLDHHDKLLNKFDRSDTNYYGANSNLRHEINNHENMMRGALSNANPTDRQMKRLMDAETIDKNSYSEIKLNKGNLAKSITESPFAKPEHLHTVAKLFTPDDLKTTDIQTTNDIRNLYQNKNVSAETKTHIANLIAKSGNKRAAEHFAQHGNKLSKDHFDTVANIGSAKYFALHNKSSIIPEQYFHDEKKTIDEDPSIAGLPQLPHSIAGEILNDNNENTIKHLVTNHGLPKHYIHTALEKLKDLTLKQYEHINVGDIINHPEFEQEDVDRVVSNLMKLPKLHGSTSWLESSKLSDNAISNIVAHPSGQYSSVLNAPRAKSKHIDALLDNENIKNDIQDSSYVFSLGHIINSNALKPSNMDKLLALQPSTRNLKKIIEDTDSEKLNAKHLHAILDNPNVVTTIKHKIPFHDSVQLSHFNRLKDEISMHGAISKSPKTPPSILHELASSPLDHVRLNVANNPNTLNETHHLLKNDPVQEIAKISTKKAK